VTTLAMVGGAEWRDGCTFDAELLELSGGKDVLVLPTAAAYEHPERAVEWATKWFKGLGGKVGGLMVLRRPDAEDKANADIVSESRFIYLGGGSPLHLRSVLKESALWEGLQEAWRDGAVVAGSSAGAMVLGDPMIDPRGGAFTLGLGMVEQLAFLPHADTWSPEKAHRTVKLAPAGLPIVAVDERTAIIRNADGQWRVSGAGGAKVWLNGKETGVEALSSLR
jgi:cyanophycinase